VVHVAVEMAPICKVGGLGDVVTALGRAVQEQGHMVEVILPRWVPGFLVAVPAGPTAMKKHTAKCACGRCCAQCRSLPASQAHAALRWDLLAAVGIA
jgi:hypothetical protein